MITFDAPSARRVADATRQAERDGRGRPVPRRPPAIGLPLMVMLVTQTVQVATSAGPGKGKGRYRTVEYAADDTATYGPPYGPEWPLYTIDTVSPTPAGKTVIVGALCGRAAVLVEVCPIT